MSKKLKEQILESSNALKQVYTMLQSPTGTEIPVSCYDHWRERAIHHEVLRETADLINARAAAWASVSNLVDSKRVQRERDRIRTDGGRANTFMLNGVEMDFTIARHLTLLSYMGTTWAIYDRLTNVCGRLAATDSIASNPKQNPKMCEDFFSKKKFHLAFALQHHLIDAYSWPVMVSYKVRNWLMHEGYEEGNIRMFRGERIEDAFILHDDARNHLKNCCDHNHRVEESPICCLSDADFPWYGNDLLKVLLKYHQEADSMLTALLKWSVNTFINQISVFAERDQSSFAAR